MVKVKGLDSVDEALRQRVASEIIEWEMGKATQRQEVSGRDGGPLKVQYINDWRDPFTNAPPRAESDTDEPRPVQVAGGGPEVAQDDTGDAGGG